MKAVIQRVSRASVIVEGKTVGRISKGILILLAVSKEDKHVDMKWIIDKVCDLRIFPNDAGKFDLSLMDIKGQALIVSQFTLYGDCRKGRRPSFDQSAPPEIAEPLYLQAIDYMKSKGIHTEAGIFGAMMEVNLCNDGPVTLIIDSPQNI